MKKELAPFRVVITDMCIHNIRASNNYAGSLKEALSESPNSALLKNHYEFPDTVSPTSGQVLNWRLIDLTAGAKTRLHEISVEGEIDEILNLIGEALPETWRPFPWVRWIPI